MKIDTNILIGAGIALVSGIITQIVVSKIQLNTEKKKFIFSKLDDIINSISSINQALQNDVANIYGVGSGIDNSKNLSFELVRIKCVIKLYHQPLEINFIKFDESLNNYFRTKREYIELQRQGVTNDKLTENLKNIGEKFDECNKNLGGFIEGLKNYIPAQ